MGHKEEACDNVRGVCCCFNFLARQEANHFVWNGAGLRGRLGVCLRLAMLARLAMLMRLSMESRLSCCAGREGLVPVRRATINTPHLGSLTDKQHQRVGRHTSSNRPSSKGVH